MEEGLPVNCALWLNKRKVFSASEIHENLDVASLRGYFLAGSLLEWLRSNGGEQYAEALSRVSPDDENLNDRIADIFGGKPLPVKTFGENFPAEQATAAEPNGIVPSSGSFPYWELSSFGKLRELFSKLQTGSSGSFSQWEQLLSRLAKYGSFTSFGFGSFYGFHEWEWEWLYRLLYGGYGSFTQSSFGSFWQSWQSLFGSFPFVTLNGFSDIFANSLSENAVIVPPKEFPILDEYDRIMFETLLKCPLDRYGYGIHNI